MSNRIRQNSCRVCSENRKFNQMREINNRLSLLDQFLQRKRQERKRTAYQSLKKLKFLQKKLRKLEGQLIANKVQSQKLRKLVNAPLLAKTHTLSNLTLGSKHIPRFESITSFNSSIDNTQSTDSVINFKSKTDIFQIPSNSTHSLTGRFCELFLQLNNLKTEQQLLARHQIMRVAGKIKDRRQKAINDYGF